VKRFYACTNHIGHAQQIAGHVQRQAVVRHVFYKACSSNDQFTRSEVLQTDPGACYQIATNKGQATDILVFLEKNRKDPAINVSQYF
jgi:hypothetical protein